jgi:hypothetical protein
MKYKIIASIILMIILALTMIVSEAQGKRDCKPNCDNDLVCLCTPAGSGGWWRRDCRKPGGGWDQIRGGCRCEWWK